MRKGSNPQKGLEKLDLKIQHRVIVVVFIPELTGYYSDSFEVLKLCLDSLIRVNNGDYKITIVNNGSCSEVSELLSSYGFGKIDSLIHHSTNIGKIDALVGAARGSREKYITLTDSDILFLEGWDVASRQLFYNFTKAGLVSPIPFRHGLFYGTSSTLKEILLRRVRFRFSEIPENFTDHNRYLHSINWNAEKDTDIKWPVIERNSVKAVVGSGHQVVTLKREILMSCVPLEPSLILVGGNSEYKYIDEPVDKAGLMRISTYNNYAFHMGNQVEDWMRNIHLKEKQVLKRIKKEDQRIKELIPFEHRIYTMKKLLIKWLFKAVYSK